MKILRTFCFTGALCVLAACGGDPPPPRSVSEFIENPISLEATMVRCAQDRSRTKYEAECVNAREAANRLAVIDEEARRKELEAQFERKRQQLRRTQQAASEARRRAAEEQRRRQEAEYLGVYETVPGEENTGGVSGAIPETAGQQSPVSENGLAGNQPGVVVAPPDEDAEQEAPAENPTDIDAIREELKRRQDSSG